MSKSNILSKEVYFKAIEESDSGLWVYDVPAGTCFLSDRYYTMLGYDPDEFEGTMENLFALLHPDDVDSSNKIFADFFSGTNYKYRNEVRLKNKTGGYNYILTQGYGERNESGEVVKFIGWNIDITPLKEAQILLDEERVKSAAQSRLAQLGLLSTGLTHEINNPLMAINLRSQLLMKMIDNGREVSSKELHEYIELVLGSTQKIESIVGGLRSIAGGDKNTNRKQFVINKVLREVLTLCQKQFEDRNVKTSLQADEEIIIDGNMTLIAQVFLNLIDNSLDALEKQEQKQISIKLSVIKGEAVTTFKDNGCGIDETKRDKIFLPFYTSKDPGKGTGLGLSISSSIIHAHGGSISYSFEQGWSNFTVRIPAAPPASDLT